MSDLAANTILEVLQSASLAYPTAASTRKVPCSCFFPDAHENGDVHRSAWLDGPRNMYGCSKCGTFTAKGLAEALGVSWPVGNGGNGHTPLHPKKAAAAIPAPDVSKVRAAYTAGLAESARVTITHPVFAYLAERSLDEACRGAEPLAVVWPENGDSLPECYAPLARAGYRLAVRLYDARSGDLASLQARFVGAGEPPDGKKVRFAPGAGQASGKVFANHAAVAMMRGTDRATAHVIVGEGLTDFLALSITHPDVPVIAPAGASVVRAAFDPAPHWMRPGMELISALDGDEPGEQGAKVLAEACKRAGVICRRVKFPDGAKDCCDILKQWGFEALRLAIRSAELPEAIRIFGKASKTAGEYRMNRLPMPESIIGQGLLRPRQFGYLFGPPGSGKSWAALDLVISAASGRDWYGIPIRQCRAGYLSLELERWDLTDRVESILHARGMTDDDLGDRLVFISPPDFDENFDLLNPEHRMALQCWIQEQGLHLAVVDTLTRAHSADERDLRPVANATFDVIRRTGAAILYVHHPRKPAIQLPGQARGPVMYDSRGDSRFIGDARFVAAMTPRRGVMELSVAKTNTGPQSQPIYLKPDSRGVLHVTELPMTKQEVAAANRHKIVECLLASDRAMQRHEIVAMTGIDTSAVKRALTVLVAEEEVQASGSTRNRLFSIRAVESPPESQRPNPQVFDFNEEPPF